MFLHSIEYNVSSVIQLSVEKLCFNKRKIYTPFVLFSFSAVSHFLQNIFWQFAWRPLPPSPIFWEKEIKIKIYFLSHSYSYSKWTYWLYLISQVKKIFYQNRQKLNNKHTSKVFKNCLPSRCGHIIYSLF